MVIDPDEEVAAAIADVFTAFTATGSAYQVVAALAGRRFPLRAYGGAWAGQLFGATASVHFPGPLDRAGEGEEEGVTHTQGVGRRGGHR